MLIELCTITLFAGYWANKTGYLGGYQKRPDIRPILYTLLF